MASNIRTYVDQNRDESSVRLADDAADAALQAEIDQIESSVGLETDGTLIALGGNYTSGSTLKAAVLSVDSQVKTNTDNISSLADPTVMQNEIDAIETGAGLSSTGTYTANSSSNYMKTSTSIVDATEDLDAQIKINTDAIAAEVSNRGAADSTIQSELDVTQTGAGLSSTGAYSANGSANYIALATSLADADNKLDTKIYNIESGLGTAAAGVLTTSNYDDTSARVSKIGDFGMGRQLVSTETNLDNYIQPGSFITPSTSLTNLPSGWSSQRYVLNVGGGSSYASQLLCGPSAVAYRWWNGTTFSSWNIIV